MHSRLHRRRVVPRGAVPAAGSHTEEVAAGGVTCPRTHRSLWQLPAKLSELAEQQPAEDEAQTPAGAD